MSDGDLTPARFEAELLREAFGAFPTGVTVVAATRSGTRVGMAASSFTSVSLNPPLVSVCIARTSSTWPVLRTGDTTGDTTGDGAGRIGVSVLADDQHVLARQFAGSGPDRFADVRATTSDDGAVLIDHACLWLECTVHAELPAGDHVIALLEVQRIETFAQRAPLVFHSSEFRQLLDPA